MFRQRILDVERRLMRLDTASIRASLARSRQDLRTWSWYSGVDRSADWSDQVTNPPGPTPSTVTAYGRAVQWHPLFTQPYSGAPDQWLMLDSSAMSSAEHVATTDASGNASFTHPILPDWTITLSLDSWYALLAADAHVGDNTDGSSASPITWRLMAWAGSSAPRYAYFFSQSNVPVSWKGNPTSDAFLVAGLNCQDRSGAVTAGNYGFVSSENVYVLFGFGRTSTYNDPPYGSSSHRYRIYGMNSADVRNSGAAFIRVEHGVLVSGVWHPYETGTLTALNPTARTATFNFTNTHTWDGGPLGDVTLTLT